MVLCCLINWPVTLKVHRSAPVSICFMESTPFWITHRLTRILVHTIVVMCRFVANNHIRHHITGAPSIKGAPDICEGHTLMVFKVRYGWLNARLQYLHCYCTGDTAVLHLTIDIFWCHVMSVYAVVAIFSESWSTWRCNNNILDSYTTAVCSWL